MNNESQAFESTTLEKVNCPWYEPSDETNQELECSMGSEVARLVYQGRVTQVICPLLSDGQVCTSKGKPSKQVWCLIAMGDRGDPC